ncbi:chloroperoxidase, partial [Francisella tularensis subsp. holarctica]|nr:chloroperoxidase [Francisella tularensis subsp. holarctica]
QYDKYISMEHTQIDTTNLQAIKLLICPEKLYSANKLFQQKTTHNSTRGLYTHLHQKYIQDKNCQHIYLNEKENITET